MLVDGPAGEHELVLKGRLQSQAPDIDACVYLTECDPACYRPGDLVEVELVGAKEYDLIARPVETGSGVVSIKGPLETTPDPVSVVI